MKIFLCGDVMLGRGIDQIQMYSAPAKIHEDYLRDARSYVKLAEGINGTIPHFVSPDYVWGEALNLFAKRKPDLRIINLETAMTTNDDYYPKGINYRMHPKNVAILEMAGIDICALANNHVLDWGIQGLHETLLTLENQNILYAGAGKSLEEAQAPAIVKTNEGRILFFSVAHKYSGVPSDWNATSKKGGVFFLSHLNRETIEDLTALINRFKKTGDTIVLSIHWGSNWGYDVPVDHKNFAHALIDYAGVDIIYGHSSHHPRPIEIYKGRPILYGCGDFINDYEGINSHQEFKGNLVLATFLSCNLNPFKLNRVDLDCLKLKKFQLTKPSLSEVRWMFDTLYEMNSEFKTPIQINEKNIFCTL